MNEQDLGIKVLKVKFDETTAEWFKQNMSTETTILYCEKCGLYYKPSLEHKCVNPIVNIRFNDLSQICTNMYCEYNKDTDTGIKQYCKCTMELCASDNCRIIKVQEGK